MKEIKKVVTREVKETFTGWEAIDGTFFDDKAECKKYEESAKGVLRGKLAKLIVNKKYNGWELLGGYEDNQILAIKPTSKEDIDVIIQNYYLDQPYFLRDDMTTKRLEIETKIGNALECNDIVLFGLNCDEDLYFIDARMNIVDRLLNLEKDEQE